MQYALALRNEKRNKPTVIVDGPVSGNGAGLPGAVESDLAVFLKSESQCAVFASLQIRTIAFLACIGCSARKSRPSGNYLRALEMLRPIIKATGSFIKPEACREFAVQLEISVSAVDSNDSFMREFPHHRVNIY